MRLAQLAASGQQVASAVVAQPTDVRIPASLDDILRGENLVGAPDGLARNFRVTSFSDVELRRLSSITGGDAVTDLLLPTGFPPVNVSYVHVRLGLEREMVSLAQCFGVERLALRTLNTTRYLRSTLQYLEMVEQQLASNSSASDAVRLGQECQVLTERLCKQQEDHETQLRDLRVTHAQEILSVGSGTSANAEISRLTAELDQLTTLGLASPLSIWT